MKHPKRPIPPSKPYKPIKPPEKPLLVPESKPIIKRQISLYDNVPLADLIPKDVDLKTLSISLDVQERYENEVYYSINILKNELVQDPYHEARLETYEKNIEKYRKDIEKYNVAKKKYDEEEKKYDIAMKKYYDWKVENTK